jgi:hypothetical protein
MPARGPLRHFLHRPIEGSRGRERCLKPDVAVVARECRSIRSGSSAKSLQHASSQRLQPDRQTKHRRPARRHQMGGGIAHLQLSGACQPLRPRLRGRRDDRQLRSAEPDPAGGRARRPRHVRRRLEPVVQRGRRERNPARRPALRQIRCALDRLGLLPEPLAGGGRRLVQQLRSAATTTRSAATTPGTPSCTRPAMPSG